MNTAVALTLPVAVDYGILYASIAVTILLAIVTTLLFTMKEKLGGILFGVLTLITVTIAILTPTTIHIDPNTAATHIAANTGTIIDHDTLTEALNKATQHVGAQTPFIDGDTLGTITVTQLSRDSATIEYTLNPTP